MTFHQYRAHVKEQGRNPDVTLEIYEDLLKHHDWFFDFADDPRAHRQGAAERGILLLYARTGNDDFKRAYNHKFLLKFPNNTAPFTLSATADATPVVRPSENQTKLNIHPPTLINMNTLLKPLGLFLHAIIVALIAAGEFLRDNETDLEYEVPEGTNNDVATGTLTGGAASTPAAATGTGRGRGRRKAEAAPAPAPAAVDVNAATAPGAAVPAAVATPPATGALTAEILRKMAEPLVQDQRGLEVQALVKRYGADKIGTLDPKHYQDVANGINALLL